MPAAAKTLLITGAASGIGRAAAMRMAGRMHILAADRNRAGVESLVDDLVRKSHRATAFEVDVTNGASVSAMAERIAREIGPVDALFNNAGISRRTRAEETSAEDWDAVMATHAKGAFLCARAVLPGMCERRSGAIVNMASDFAVMGMAGAAAYCAAKSAVYSLTKSLALEFAPFGIRVNALGPGPIDTPLLRSGRSEAQWAEAEARNRARVPLGRLGRPEDVAAVLDFLLSERSSYITGQIIHPNGGALSW